MHCLDRLQHFPYSSPLRRRRLPRHGRPSCWARRHRPGRSPMRLCNSQPRRTRQQNSTRPTSTAGHFAIGVDRRQRVLDERRDERCGGSRGTVRFNRRCSLWRDRCAQPCSCKRQGVPERTTEVMKACAGIQLAPETRIGCRKHAQQPIDVDQIAQPIGAVGVVK